jgi:predicted metal-dependent hydrolase
MKEEFINLNQVTIPALILKGKPNRTAFRFKNQLLVIETRTGKIAPYDLAVIEEKKNWILKHYQNITANINRKADYLRQVIDHGKILYLGQTIPFSYSIHSRNLVNLNDSGLHYRLTAKRFNNRPFTHIVAEALLIQSESVLNTLVTPIADRMKLIFNRLSVKNLSSKWGSCSSKRNLNFNWHVIHLRQPVIEYLIIHEICHLVHLNHSDAFWDLVQSYCPDYENLERELRNNEWLIGIYQ